jgi:hypothetical protein
LDKHQQALWFANSHRSLLKLETAASNENLELQAADASAVSEQFTKLQAVVPTDELTEITSLDS